MIEKEYEKTKNRRLELERKINALPKGHIQPKNIRGLLYYYLQFREGKKVKTQYIPKKELPRIKKDISERKKLEKKIKTILDEEEKLAIMLGKHAVYRPVKKINNEEYVLFMSTVAHDYKRMDKTDFLEKYKPVHFRGLQKKYVKGFTDYITGSYEKKIRKGNDLVLDPYTYYMYFEVGDKSVLQKELQSAIPEFLNQGLLVTSIQEAVHGA